MQEQDKREIKDIVEKTARSYFPVSRINLAQIMQGLILAGIVWIGAEFKTLSNKSIAREQEMKSLKEDISELKAEVRYLRAALFEHNKNDVKK